MNETPAYWLFVTAAVVNLFVAVGGAMSGNVLDVSIERGTLFAIASGVLAVAVKKGGNNG